MDFLSLLSKKLNGKYDFLKVLKVVYNTTFSLCHINFIYPENVPNLSDSQKLEIKTAVQEVIEIKGKLDCKFNKSYLDKNIIITKIQEFFNLNFNSISSSFDYSNIKYVRNALVVELSFLLNKSLYKYFKENDISDILKNYLKENFCGDFIIFLKENENEDFNENLENRAFEIQSSIQTTEKTPRYPVENVNLVFGSEIMPMPEYIEYLKSEKFAVILSGIVGSLEQKEYLPKKNKLKGLDEKRKMFKFKLNDGSASVNCVHFCTKVSEKHFSLIEEGSQVLCLGDYVKSYYGDMQYIIKSMALCSKVKNENIEEKSIEENKVIEGYKYVFPTPYTRIIQDNIFDKKCEYPDYIKNNTFVVFDVETTGLIPDKNEITEIGAVKIVNGEIVERFQTLCKPHQIISKEITSLTGISNEMVENERAPEDIIEDFLFFAKDSIMVGYNVNFDYQFIQFAAMKKNRTFNNEFRDCMGDAKNKLFLPNYKLGTVVEHLGITLNNAHRALYDATATAEAFLKLSLM